MQLAVKLTKSSVRNERSNEMIILITQFVILAFGLTCLYCEVSNKYRDCNWHVSVRWVLMMASIVLAFKVSVFAVSSLFIQVLALLVTCITAKFLYKKVLRRQVRIKNFNLKKLYLHNFQNSLLNKE